MEINDKGFTLPEALFAMLIVAAAVAAALEIHSLTLKNRARAEVSSFAESEIESLMEKDRGRLKTLIKSGAKEPVQDLFSHVQSSPVSCKNTSGADCLNLKSGKICRAPESLRGVVKIKYVACVGKHSFKGEQFIHVPQK